MVTGVAVTGKGAQKPLPVSESIRVARSASLGLSNVNVTCFLCKLFSPNKLHVILLVKHPDFYAFRVVPHPLADGDRVCRDSSLHSASPMHPEVTSQVNHMIPTSKPLVREAQQGWVSFEEIKKTSKDIVPRPTKERLAFVHGN